MTTTTTATASYTLTVDGIGPTRVSVTERGQGHPFLLLHGGGGPRTVGDFADLLAETQHARVLAPTHPGFASTARPEALTTIRGLAAVYIALLDELGLSDVTIVGNSIGGWIAAEMGLFGSDRISSIVLADAVGIQVPDHPVADFFSLTMDQVAQLSYHDPDTFRIDLSAMPAEQQATMAGNRSALAVYAGTASMGDPTLRGRLSAITAPTLVLWGDSDRIADPDYGRAYAQAIPTARFELLSETGHLPQIESPQLALSSIWAFAASHATNRPNR